jgi:hypothetical protein
MLKPQKDDEYLHYPDERLKWRESYYFNWIDRENQISGFSTIGILPNEKKREFVFILFLDDDLAAIYYQESSLDVHINDLNSILTDEILTYRLEQPLELWKIKFVNENIKFLINFKTRFIPYDFGRDSSASWQGHFESSGNVTGFVELINKGEKRKVKGFGQRDKSWGYRDWHQFDKWYAGHIQFNDYVITFRKDYHNGNIDLSGYYASKQGVYSLTSLDVVNIQVEDDGYNTPLSSTYIISSEDAHDFELFNTRLGRNTSFRFAREFTGGYTELFEQMVVIKCNNTGKIGTGMAEYLRTIKKK